MEPLYWRLAYPDDHVEDEPDDGASILLSRPGAVRLFAMRPTPEGRQPSFAVWLVDPDTQQHFKPIFYRRRAALRSHDPRAAVTILDATVAGRGIATHKMNRAARRNAKLRGQPIQDVGFDGTVWASLDGETWGDCPREHFDEAAITNLLYNTA